MQSIPQISLLTEEPQAGKQILPPQTKAPPILRQWLAHILMTTSHAKMLLIWKPIRHPKLNKTGTQVGAYNRLAVGCSSSL